MILLIVSCILSLLGPQTPAAAQVVSQRAFNDTFCRFGIGAPKGPKGYDLSLLGVGAYLDWQSARSSTVPDNIRFFHVLPVGNDRIGSTRAILDERLAEYLGAIWIIGNEPDSEVLYQDHITAQEYADRYYEIATKIRKQDPTARLGFGTVIMPTPIRMRYLELALAHLDFLVKLDNPAAKATDFIDIFTIHAFLLNEQPGSWGAGVPLGYDPNTWPAPIKIQIGGDKDETWKTHSIDIFRERIINFRGWMNQQGFRNKPLWVTEYGSLFPSDSNIYLTVPETETAAYMRQTFDFMLTAKDAVTGYPADDNRLVQHFVWYSLNDDLWHFGGSLIDPATRIMTLVGNEFSAYDPPDSSLLVPAADVTIVAGNLKVYPVGRSAIPGYANYRVVFRATNLIASEYRTRVRVEFYDNGQKLEESNIEGFLPRCGGQGVFSFVLRDRLPGDTRNFSARVFLLGGNGSESNPGNDQIDFPPVTLDPLYQTFFPVISRQP